MGLRPGRARTPRRYRHSAPGKLPTDRCPPPVRRLTAARREGRTAVHSCPCPYRCAARRQRFASERSLECHQSDAGDSGLLGLDRTLAVETDDVGLQVAAARACRARDRLKFAQGLDRIAITNLRSWPVTP